MVRGAPDSGGAPTSNNNTMRRALLASPGLGAKNPYKQERSRRTVVFLVLAAFALAAIFGASINKLMLARAPSTGETSSLLDVALPKGIKPRAYDPWPRNRPFQCSKPDPGLLEREGQDLPKTKEGFLFIKTFKTGSSTASGINLRIAGNEAKRQKKPYEVCKSRFDHVRPLRVCPDRNKSKSYLWTIVRQPAKRLVSMFFHFGVTREGFEPNGENLAGYVRNETDFVHEYYLKYLSHKEYWFTQKRDDPVDVVNQILRDFDFVAVTGTY